MVVVVQEMASIKVLRNILNITKVAHFRYFMFITYPRNTTIPSATSLPNTPKLTTMATDIIFILENMVITKLLPT